MKKSKALTFFLSAVPGLGHYYLGQMLRGLQMMSFFFGSIFILSFLRLDYFPFLLPIIWFYSLFDALEQHRIITKEQQIIDKPMITIEKIKLKKQWVGWGLIILGGYLFLDKLFFDLFSYRYYDTFRVVFVAGIFIISGWYLLSGKKISKQNPKEEHAEGGNAL